MTAKNLFVDELIERAIREPLNLEEIEDVLLYYQDKVHLAEYIIGAILDNVKEKTVWGFSQAISWVRNIGELKKGRLPR